MFKNTLLYSIFFNKCPRCHTGNFFKYNNAYKLPGFSEMNLKCEHCKESFEKETGYYFGAMFVSYALNIALGVGLFLLLVLALNIDTLIYLFTFLGSVLVLFPWVFRTSRLIWINIFVRFNAQLKKKI